MATAEESVGLLGQVPVFETLAPEDLQRVVEVAVPRSFPGHHVIFREGDASDTCYVVRSGHARAIREHPDGRMIALAHFGPGDIFGELAMFDDELRSATVETLDEVQAIAVLGSDMRRLLREHPDIAVKLVIALGRRLREANERLARQSFQTVQSRVAVVLDGLVRQAQSEGAGAGDVLVRITQADIAQLAGSSRESASRFIAVLERAGVITQGRGRITVHDPDALLMLPVRIVTAVWLVFLTAVLYGYGRGGWWGALLVPAAALHLYIAYRLIRPPAHAPGPQRRERL